MIYKSPLEDYDESIINKEFCIEIIEVPVAAINGIGDELEFIVDLM